MCERRTGGQVDGWPLPELRKEVGAGARAWGAQERSQMCARRAFGVRRGRGKRRAAKGHAERGAVARSCMWRVLGDRITAAVGELRLHAFAAASVLCTGGSGRGGAWPARACGWVPTARRRPACQRACCGVGPRGATPAFPPSPSSLGGTAHHHFARPPACKPPFSAALPPSDRWPAPARMPARNPAPAAGSQGHAPHLLGVAARCPPSRRAAGGAWPPAAGDTPLCPWGTSGRAPFVGEREWSTGGGGEGEAVSARGRGGGGREGTCLTAHLQQPQPVLDARLVALHPAAR